MPYHKNIICLAKSLKHGGYCIAGKEVDSGNWVRPVSNREDEEIRPEDCVCEGEVTPGLFDVLSIPLLEPRPTSYQQENHLIDQTQKWTKLRNVIWDDVMKEIDDIQGPLWSNSSSTYYGIHDRISEVNLNQFSSSLALIKPTDLKICVEIEGAEFGNPRKKTRADFRYNNHHYKIAVTDPVIKEKFWPHLGQHPIGNPSLICVSLGEIHEGYAYKLAAAIITKDVIRKSSE